MDEHKKLKQNAVALYCTASVQVHYAGVMPPRQAFLYGLPLPSPPPPSATPPVHVSDPSCHPPHPPHVSDPSCHPPPPPHVSAAAPGS